MQSPLEHPFFKRIDIEALNVQTFDQRLAEHPGNIVGVFFWGHDCPNCEVAKGVLSDQHVKMGEFGFKWFHVNVYENFDLGTRFGLHGVPAFIFFKDGVKLGRITPFPGAEPFFEALATLKTKVLG